MKGMHPISLLQRFRQALYENLPMRADATLDCLDALTVAGHVASPVALSEEVPFRRKFSAIYDLLQAGQLAGPTLQPVLSTHPPADCETLAGYEVYALDTTPDARPEAATLPARQFLKAQKDTPAVPGEKFSWLVRLVQQRTSWVAPWDVRRVPPASTDSQTAVAQLTTLAQQHTRPKVVVADSLYANHVFLAVFLVVQTLVALVRLRRNQTLYEAPPSPVGKRKRGAPRKHGPKFKLAAPQRDPDRTETGSFLGQTLRLRAWHGLHFRKLPTLAGLALCVEFLKPDGTCRYQRPLWLFWTGPTTVALQDLCQMYLWRFAIEHAFRFMKQHFGLTAHCLTQPTEIQNWVWLCALAYWQLLLMRHDVDDLCPAWYPRQAAPTAAALTPGQVQRGASRFLVRLGTPAAPPKPAGKGRGRAVGYHPAPRTRYEVVRKSPKAPRQARTPAKAGG
jgi:hypothetical protein